jgi:hypothetical protein
MPRVLDLFRFVLIALAGCLNQRQPQVIDYLREENPGKGISRSPAGQALFSVFVDRGTRPAHRARESCSIAEDPANRCTIGGNAWSYGFQLILSSESDHAVVRQMKQ